MDSSGRSSISTHGASAPLNNHAQLPESNRSSEDQLLSNSQRFSLNLNGNLDSPSDADSHHPSYPPNSKEYESTLEKELCSPNKEINFELMKAIFTDPENLVKHKQYLEKAEFYQKEYLGENSDNPLTSGNISVMQKNQESNERVMFYSVDLGVLSGGSLFDLSNEYSLYDVILRTKKSSVPNADQTTRGIFIFFKKN
ncbi:hypothetical protein AYI68_g6699 [Smittium mucronatum]|uniref:Uncharacterized protein n=1 Tax=Smittium mucronatum TaxID=133383 RepID=A0A1R0GQS0_9FUNG|nr:hypothetical protein AYI68_g6699 [Smittium mucronatum]